ncbi:unnamed protein product [Boreogadus saida]
MTSCDPGLCEQPAPVACDPVRDRRREAGAWKGLPRGHGDNESNHGRNVGPKQDEDQKPRSTQDWSQCHNTGRSQRPHDGKVVPGCMSVGRGAEGESVQTTARSDPPSSSFLETGDSQRQRSGPLPAISSGTELVSDQRWLQLRTGVPRPVPHTPSPRDEEEEEGD